jgi:hypothetical protein
VTKLPHTKTRRSVPVNAASSTSACNRPNSQTRLAVARPKRARNFCHAAMCTPLGKSPSELNSGSTDTRYQTRSVSIRFGDDTLIWECGDAEGSAFRCTSPAEVAHRIASARDPREICSPAPLSIEAPISSSHGCWAPLIRLPPSQQPGAFGKMVVRASRFDYQDPVAYWRPLTDTLL